MAAAPPSHLLSTRRHLSSSPLNHGRSFPQLSPTFSLLSPNHSRPSWPAFTLSHSLRQRQIVKKQQPLFIVRSTGDIGGGGDGNNGGSGGGGDDSDGEDDASDKNRTEAMLALAEIGRSLDSLPSDLAGAIEAGRIPGLIVHRFAELEKSAVMRWLLRFGGFKERLLADDLFLAKVAMECGVGIFTKFSNHACFTAAESGNFN